MIPNLKHSFEILCIFKVGQLLWKLFFVVPSSELVLDGFDWQYYASLSNGRAVDKSHYNPINWKRRESNWGRCVRSMNATLCAIQPPNARVCRMALTCFSSATPTWFSMISVSFCVSIRIWLISGIPAGRRSWVRAAGGRPTGSSCRFAGT